MLSSQQACLFCLYPFSLSHIIQSKTKKTENFMMTLSCSDGSNSHLRISLCIQMIITLKFCVSSILDCVLMLFWTIYFCLWFSSQLSTVCVLLSLSTFTSVSFSCSIFSCSRLFFLISFVWSCLFYPSVTGFLFFFPVFLLHTLIFPITLWLILLGSLFFLCG